MLFHFLLSDWVTLSMRPLNAEIDKDLRAGTEGRSGLIEIRREEPDRTLFDTPPRLSDKSQLDACFEDFRCA